MVYGRFGPEQIYDTWAQALANDDIEAMVAMYSEDAIVECPLIPYLMGGPRNFCKGRDEIRQFFRKIARRKRHARQYVRFKSFIGEPLPQDELIPEPKAAPEPTESMEFNRHWLIQKHRLNKGPFGFDSMQNNLWSC